MKLLSLLRLFRNLKNWRSFFALKACQHPLDTQLGHVSVVNTIRVRIRALSEAGVLLRQAQASGVKPFERAQVVLHLLPEPAFSPGCKALLCRNGKFVTRL